MTFRGMLSGRRAMVTGSVEGIGAAIARLFALEGATVMLTGRREDAGQKTAASIRRAGGAASFTAADATSEQAVRALVDACANQLGGLDILVNNAAIAPSGSLAEMSLETWNETMACNLTSMFLVTKYALPLLCASPHASVINMGSTFGAVGVPHLAAYAVTKAGAISFSKSMALELAPQGIRVNALCPGATRTELMERSAAAAPEGYVGAVAAQVARHPLGRLSTPEEQAAAALFLASDQSSFVTGQALFADGGYTAQ